MIPDFANPRGGKTPDYVEGRWTPTFVGSSTAGVFTYSTQTGRYTRIGNLCTIRATIAISAIGTPPVGNMQINGLPFVAASQDGGVAFGYIAQFNNAANAVMLTGLIINGNQHINLYECFDNAAAATVPGSNFTNAACELRLFGQYQVT